MPTKIYLSSNQDFHPLSITRSATFPGEPESVFAQITPQDILPKVLTGFGPIPAVVGTTQHQGNWGQPGAFRVVCMKDGSTVKEQLTAFDRPHGFAYRVWDFDNKLIRFLADGGTQGQWQFHPLGDSTRVRWTYTFLTSRRLRSLPLALIINVFWRGYMDVCLKNFQKMISAATKT